MDQEQIENVWRIMREHNLEFVDDLSSEYKCIICKKILINACMAPCCCRFCVECVREYLKDRKLKCPGQSQLCTYEYLNFDMDIQINRVINKRISELSVKCPNNGCQSQVKLIMIGDHLRICDNQPESCPYCILGCEEDNIGKDRVKDHISLDIHSHTKLLINWMRFSENETKSMKRDIDQLKADNDEIKEKMRSDEERTNNIIRDLQQREMASNSEIEILNEEMCALKNCNRSLKDEMETLKDKQTNKVSQLESKLKHQTQEIEELKTKEQIQCQEIKELIKKCQQAENKFEVICYQAKELKDAQIKLNESKSIENMPEINSQLDYTEFDWKIDNWSVKSSKTIHSDHFLTHKNGYEIRLSASPDWNHKWIYFVFYVLRGPFDHILQWPLNRDLEISLMDQVTGRPYKSKIRKYSISSALERPVSEIQKYDFGFEMPLSEISRRPELCLNDQVFIKFSAKPAEHPR